MTIKTWIFSLAMVFSGWVMIQISVMYFTDAAPGALMLFPDLSSLGTIPEDISILSAGDGWMIVTSDKEDLGKSLYSMGAWLVFPAGLPGCVPLP